MIDVGYPFARPLGELIDSLQESLLLGVEQQASLALIYRQGVRAYPISSSGPVVSLADQATGLVNGKPAVFARGQHYVLQAGQLVWQPPATTDTLLLEAWFPDGNSWLTLGYAYRGLASGITDFNEGSVAGTLVRAVSRELKLLFDQMDQAYRRAFIDHAQGVALDNVVALLGIVRNPALPAQGKVTFALKKAPSVDVAIALGTRVADASGRVFKVAEAGVVRAVASASATVWAVTVPVVALDAGPEGNLPANSLNVMPTPPRGVDGGVSNKEGLSGGMAAESDEALRERARHELERAGNATLIAIRYAVLNVDGVESVDVSDFSLDPRIALGEVSVRFGSKLTEPTPLAELTARVARAVDETRAAGIRARVERVELSQPLDVLPSAQLGLHAAGR